MQAVIETGFDLWYLATVISLGILIIRNAGGRKQYLLFGCMAVTLGAGDSFHLIPRAFALCTTGLANYTAALGIGKFVTSITMTIFYVILFYVWRERYRARNGAWLTGIVWFLAAVRIALCLFPQNAWLDAAPALNWGIYRNIPFALLGLVIVVAFHKKSKQYADRPFQWMWLTIVLSFAFYMPVVFWADAVPLVGMLMIPKTSAYVWAVLIGYKAMKQPDPAVRPNLAKQK